MGNDREQLSLVIIGHVDHGKSTVLGRLLSDTHSLPQGKLETIQEYCKKNSRVFEYAFLLDALKEEQAQGITMDTARCFFKTKRRDYLIIDAPGHVEFIKNMITGAARAEAALIVIDIKEGIRENTRRHGYIVSLLGIRQVVVVVNKMDLASYCEDAFAALRDEYSEFLKKVGVEPISFIPVSARNGENIATPSPNMPWYRGALLLEQIELLETTDSAHEDLLRFPIQDVYKFTASDDDRRILAGLVQSGTIERGDEVVFYPSCKRSKVRSVELFGQQEITSAPSGFSVGITLEDPLYIKSGEIMAKAIEHHPPLVGQLFLANFFWMGSTPLLLNQDYKIKFGTLAIMARVVEIRSLIDSTDLSSIADKKQLERYNVAECVFAMSRPAAFDRAVDFTQSGRFVLIDHYNISGCGIIVDKLEQSLPFTDRALNYRELHWDRGFVSDGDRILQNHHSSKFILFSGRVNTGKRAMAKALESALFKLHYQAYYLGYDSLSAGFESDLGRGLEALEEKIRRTGELARILTGAGLIFITVLDDVDVYDVRKLRKQNEPHEMFVVGVGSENAEKDTYDFLLENNAAPEQAADSIVRELGKKEILLDYY